MKLEEQPNNKEKISAQESRDTQISKEKSPEGIENTIAQKNEYAKEVTSSMSSTEKQLEEVRLSMGLPTDNLEKPHSIQSGEGIVASVTGEVDDLEGSLSSGEVSTENTVDKERKEVYSKKVLKLYKENLEAILKPYHSLYAILINRERDGFTQIVEPVEIDYLVKGVQKMVGMIEQDNLTLDNLAEAYKDLDLAFENMLVVPPRGQQINDRADSLNEIMLACRDMIDTNGHIVSNLEILDESDGKVDSRAIKDVIQNTGVSLNKKIESIWPSYNALRDYENLRM